MPWNLVKSPRLQIFLENIKCVKAKPSAQQYLKVSKKMEKKKKKKTTTKPWKDTEKYQLYGRRREETSV